MSDLKPCPFCGSEDVDLVRLFLGTSAVRCNRCDADVVFYSTVTLDVGLEQDEAVSELWNRRAAREEARDE